MWPKFFFKWTPRIKIIAHLCHRATCFSSAISVKSELLEYSAKEFSKQNCFFLHQILFISGISAMNLRSCSPHPPNAHKYHLPPKYLAIYVYSLLLQSTVSSLQTIITYIFRFHSLSRYLVNSNNSCCCNTHKDVVVVVVVNHLQRQIAGKKQLFLRFTLKSGGVFILAIPKPQIKPI